MFKNSFSLLKIITVLVVIFVAIANWCYLSTGNLHPDEAYYWVWSQNLAPGYFDNSPGIAYVIRLFTAIGGNSEFWVRLPAWFSWFFFIGFSYFFAKRIYRDQVTAWFSVLIAAFTPLVASGSHLATPDFLLSVCAAFTWYFLYQAIEEGKKTAWYWVGLSLGFALLTKLQGGLLGVTVVLMLLARPSKRRLLLTKEPYLAALIAFLLFLPVLLWNAGHQWAPFVYQAGHGTGSGIKPALLLEFLIGQIGVFSLLFLALAYYTIKRLAGFRKTENGDAFLIACFLPIFLFFCLTSLTYPAGPNWPAAAYMPAIIFLAGQLVRTWRKGRPVLRWLLTGFITCCFGISILALIIVRYPGFFIESLHVKVPSAMTNATYGWDETARALDRRLALEFPNEGRTIPLFTDGSFQKGAELQFYTKTPVLLLTTRQSRRSFFDDLTLERAAEFDGRAGLLIFEDPLPPSTALYFERVRPVDSITIQRFGKEIRSYTIYRFERLNAGALREMALHKPIKYPGVYPDTIPAKLKPVDKNPDPLWRLKIKT
jgi:dolichol-phosphate mannosyltransferase